MWCSYKCVSSFHLIRLVLRQVMLVCNFVNSEKVESREGVRVRVSVRVCSYYNMLNA